MAKHNTSAETRDERLNRELDQLLRELRVAMPGVQVLFAFLLAVPFQQRFAEVTDFQQDVYFATLLASAVASALFIAATAYYRRVADFIFGGPFVVVTFALSVAMFAGLWFMLGIVRRMSDERSRDE